MEITVRPLDAPFGAEIVGFDGAKSLDIPGVAEQLKDAFERNAFLLFRNLDIDADEQLRLASAFGTVSQQGENAKRSGRYGFISNVEKIGFAPTGELPFHMDHCFYPKPLRGLMLYGIDIPPKGGDTLFSNGSLAFEMLSGAMRSKIATKQALHVHDYAQRVYTGRIREAGISPESPRAVHPVAMKHPVTGRPILYVCRRHTDRIMDVPPEESESMLDELIPFAQRREVIYQHVWRPRDLIVWDNLMLQHARTDFDPTAKRTLRRIQIA